MSLGLSENNVKRIYYYELLMLIGMSAILGLFELSVVTRIIAIFFSSKYEVTVSFFSPKNNTKHFNHYHMLSYSGNYLSIYR